MAHDAIRLHYYSGYKRSKMFAPMGSKEEAEWKKKHEEHMAASKERAKRSKIEEPKVAESHDKNDDRFQV